MYTFAINTNNYDINLIMKKFGRKTGKSLKRTMKKVDPVRLKKEMTKCFASFKLKNVSLPW